jgi:hypothetical protein
VKKSDSKRRCWKHWNYSVKEDRSGGANRKVHCKKSLTWTVRVDPNQLNSHMWTTTTVPCRSSRMMDGPLRSFCWGGRMANVNERVGVLNWKLYGGFYCSVSHPKFIQLPRFHFNCKFRVITGSIPKYPTALPFDANSKFSYFHCFPVIFSGPLLMGFTLYYINLTLYFWLTN